MLNNVLSLKPHMFLLLVFSEGSNPNANPNPTPNPNQLQFLCYPGFNLAWFVHEMNEIGCKDPH